MTTIRELVTDAFRENNLIQVGDVPEGTEYNEAEKRLTSFIRSLFGYEFGENLINVSLDASTVLIPANSRVVLGSAQPLAITLAEHPRDGERFAVLDPKGLITSFTVVAGTGTIELADSITLLTANSDVEWFYRADKANWYRVTDLTADDESPFPTEFDDLLITWLAIRIAPRMGAKTLPESSVVNRRIKQMFTARYRQEVAMYPDQALVRTASLRTHGFEV